MVHEVVIKALNMLKFEQIALRQWYNYYGLPIEEGFENNDIAKAIKLLEQLIEDETNNS